MDHAARRQVGLLERECGEVSQFHKGAGEDATLDLFRVLQGIPQYSLLLIDEVEASLHPQAQRRLIRLPSAALLIFLRWRNTATTSIGPRTSTKSASAIATSSSRSFRPSSPGASWNVGASLRPRLLHHSQHACSRLPTGRRYRAPRRISTRQRPCSPRNPPAAKTSRTRAIVAGLWYELGSQFEVVCDTECPIAPAIVFGVCR
ncbi:AAA family ATPase [Paraburkholderia sp. EG286B]|uniref:AAA family ATPase n=1 Tax=Paraburkholderia sp. EG286B TaxID=3237011 RepID=UPI0034D24DD8